MAPANAGDTALILDPGTTDRAVKLHCHHTLLHGVTRPSAPQLLNLCSRVWGPQLLRSHAKTAEAHMPWSLCATTREATAMRSLHAETKEQSPLHVPQLEKS